MAFMEEDTRSSESVKLGALWKDKDGKGVSGSLDDGPKVRLRKLAKAGADTVERFELRTFDGDPVGTFELKEPREGGTPYLDGYIGEQAVRIWKNTKKFKPTSPDYTIKTRTAAKVVAAKTVNADDLPF